MTPEEIRQARFELGLSRAQLAAILGTDTRRIRRLEGEASPRTRKLLSMGLGWLALAPLGGHWPGNWPAG